MDVSEKLQNLLKEIVPDVWELVCTEEKLPEEYIVHNSEIDVPEDFGDNAPQEWVHHIQVHLYTKKSYKQSKKAIRKALKKTGFTINSIENMYDKESGYYHICFSCEIQEEREE